MTANKEPKPSEDKISTPPLKLEVLMRDISKEDRLVILEHSGNAPATWWNWCRTPRIIPGGALNLILIYLSKKHGRVITTEEAYTPVI